MFPSRLVVDHLIRVVSSVVEVFSDLIRSSCSLSAGDTVKSVNHIRDYRCDARLTRFAPYTLDETRKVPADLQTENSPT